MPRAAVSRDRHYDKFECVKSALRVLNPRGPDLYGLRRKRFEILLELFDLTVGIVFVVGSFCFLHEWHMMGTGCWLFIFGAVISTFCTMCDLAEAQVHGKKLHDEIMYIMYCVGSFFYLLGTPFYFPEWRQAEDVRGGYSGALIGSIFFIVGSLFFIIACFINGAAANVHHAEEANIKLLVICSANSTMLGSCSFLVGSVLYLPHLRCSVLVIEFGTYLFILGSFWFVAASALRCVIQRVATAHRMSLTYLPLTDIADELVQELQAKLEAEHLVEIEHILSRLQRKIHDEKVAMRWNWTESALDQNRPAEVKRLPPDPILEQSEEGLPGEPGSANAAAARDAEAPQFEVYVPPSGRMCATAGFDDDCYEYDEPQPAVPEAEGERDDDFQDSATDVKDGGKP